MATVHSTFVILLMLINVGIILSFSKCFHDPDCFCNYPIKPGKLFKIYCVNVTDIFKVQSFLHSKFHAQKIDQLELSGCFLDFIPSKVFNDLEITILKLKCPLKELDDSSFLGIQNLQTVELDISQIESIPKAVTNIPVLLSLKMNQGNLKTINDELKDATTITELLLTRNPLAHVSPTAFTKTTSIRVLDLSDNELTYLETSTLECLQYLESVNLSGNSLQTVSGVFDKLNPVEINLAYNNLTSIDNVFNHSMTKLQRLILSGNLLGHLNASSFSENLEQLNLLDISNCQLVEMDPHLLQVLPHLSQLILKHNEIREFPDGFFRGSHLETIDVSENRIEFLTGNLPRGTTTKYVYFQGNNISSIGRALSSVPNVQELDLSRNRIEAVLDSDFKSTRSLKHLNISANEISRLDKECFQPLDDLKSLDLSNNIGIKKLNDSLENLSVRILYLNSTSLETLDMNDFHLMSDLKDIYIKNSKLTFVNESFSEVSHLWELDLSENNLTTLARNTFTSIHVLKLFLENNPWSCDCRLQWLVDFIVQTNGSHLLDEPLCDSPPNLRNKQVRNLTTDDVTYLKYNCPDDCECICHVDDQLAYAVVNCSNKEIDHIGSFPANSREIYLDNNKITNVGDKEFEGLTDLSILNLENNRVPKLGGILPKKLETLRLARNSLKRFPYIGINKRYFRIITLSGNPWSCDCSTWPFRNWLLENNNSVIDWHDVRCSEHEGIFLKNEVIASLDYEDLCTHKRLNIIIGIVGAISFVILIAFSACYRKSLAAVLYSCGWKFLKKEECTTWNVFDGFLLFSEKDDTFARLELARVLENEDFQFSLCLPGRDCETGDDAKINSALRESSRIILVLTRHFLTDPRCLSTFRASINVSLDVSARRVIVVKCGDLPPVTDIDADLGTIIKSSTCVTWGEMLFWRKMKFAMPRKSEQTFEQVIEGTSETAGLLEDA